MLPGAAAAFGGVAVAVTTVRVADGYRGPDTQALSYDARRHRSLAPSRLKVPNRPHAAGATKSRPRCKGTVMQPGGQPDMSALLAQAQQMQQQLMAAQQRLANAEVHGKAGGGLVEVTVKGSGEVVAVKIDPKVVDPDDVETLQDLIVGALADASAAGHHDGAGATRSAGRWNGQRAGLFEGPVQDLIDELGKLPGIGPKSAQRIAFHLLSVEPPDIDRLTAVLAKVRDGVRFCAVCGNVSDDERCRICADPRRDGSQVCVVEEPKDIQAVERTREFRGRYHVLGGALDPLSGVGPEQLRIRELLNRIGQQVDGVDITEVIIATDPNTEGEATATYLVRMLRDIPGLTVTRIASGLPMGGDLEFADELTLGRALTGRRAMA